MNGIKSVWKLVVYALAFVILSFASLTIFINTSGAFFWIELIIFLLFALLFFIGLLGYTKHWSDSVFFTLFFLYVINFVLIWLVHGSFFPTLIIIALIGFFVAFPTYSAPQPISEEPHSIVFDEPAPVVKATKTAAKKVAPKKKFSPGKFVASSNSNMYHVPKCEWAKKIKKERRRWFDKKEDAWEQGYKAHNCV